MAGALRINASSGPPGSPQERNRITMDSQGGNNDKRNPSVRSDKYIHVHHYLDTGRWGTWFNDPTLKRGSGKRRLYFGTYETEYLAARAQDRAALKFKTDAVRSVTPLNFAESDYVLDEDLRDRLTHGQFRRLLMAESRKCYKRAEPSPCWKIFLEEEAAKGNINIEYESRSNRYHRQPRAFTEVLQEIVSKNEAVDTEEATAPINDPVTTGEEECKVYSAKRYKHPTQAAPNQPAEQVTKEIVAEDPAALPARSPSAPQVRKAVAAPVAAPPVRYDTRRASLSAPQVRKAVATPVAAPPVRYDTRSASLSAPQVRKEVATSVAAPPVRHDSRSASLSAPQVRKAVATPVAAPPVRHETRSANLSAPQVRKAVATPVGAPTVRHDTRSASVSAPQVRKAIATPKAAPPVRRDSKSARLSARPVYKATPKGAPSVRHDTRSTSLSAPQIRKATPQAPPVVRRETRTPSQSARPVPEGAPEAAPPVPPVVRRETRNPSQSARPVPEGAPEAVPEAAPPVRREPSIFKRPAEAEGRSALQTSHQTSVYLDRLEWGRTRGRSTRNFNKLSLPKAATTDEGTVAAESMNIRKMSANVLSEVPNGNSDTSDGKVALGGDHTAVETIPSKRRRLNIDLNREPEPSTTAGPVTPSHGSDATGGNDNPEVSSVQTLLLLKGGWLK